MVGDVLEVLRPRANENGVELASTIADDVPTLLLVDSVRTRQVLLNLVGNAVKFTIGGNVDVVVGGTQGAGPSFQLTIDVVDDGVGIPEDRQEAIFESFEQASSTTSSQYGGTGLGLPIARALARLAGGDLTVSSEADCGSTFHLELPTRAIRDRRSAQRSQPDLDLDLDLLVAEDDPTNQLVTRRQLEQLGCRVRIAANGLEALELLAEHDFDAVLMDCHMPDLDGLAATRRQRTREKESGLPRVPVLAFTASVLDEDRRACLDAGMDDVVTKPFVPRELAATLRHWTRRDPEAA